MKTIIDGIGFWLFLILMFYVLKYGIILEQIIIGGR